MNYFIQGTRSYGAGRPLYKDKQYRARQAGKLPDGMDTSVSGQREFLYGNAGQTPFIIVGCYRMITAKMQETV